MPTDSNQGVPDNTDKIAEVTSMETKPEPSLDERLQNLETQFAELSEAFAGYTNQIQQDIKLISQLAQQTERRAFEVGQVHQAVNQTNEAISSAILQLGGLDGLDTLKQEHKNILATLQNLQAGNQRLHDLQMEGVQAEERLALTQQKVEEINNLITTAQAELVKQAMALTEDLQQRYAGLSTLASSADAASPDRFASSTTPDREMPSQLQEFSRMKAEATEAMQALRQLLAQAQTQTKSTSDAETQIDEPDYGFDTPVIEYAPEPEASPASASTPRPTLEQIRAEVYGIAQQAKMDKEALQREQKQKLKALEQKQKSLKTWLLAVTSGTVLAFVLGAAALAMRLLSPR